MKFRSFIFTLLLSLMMLGNALAVETGGISGTVTDGATGSPLEEVLVYAQDVSSGVAYQGVLTDSAGAYRISGLPSGSYNLLFSKSGFIRMYFGGRLEAFNSKSVPVSAPDTHAGVNMALEKGGAITGKITEASTGTGLSGALVMAVALERDDSREVAANPDGTYAITGLPAGDYLIRASGSGYVPMWYDDQFDLSEMTLITVTASSATEDINLNMARVGGSITGKVRDGISKAGIQAAHINIYDTTGEWIAGGWTGETGDYGITGLPSGDYAVEFEADDYISQWYAGGKVTVTEPAATTGIDADLFLGGVISGQVLDGETGIGVSGATVEIVDTATGNVAASTISKSNGGFTALDIPAGTYRLRLSATGYPTTWHKDATPEQDVAQITLIPPGSVDGISARIVKGGFISGAVTDSETGTGIPAITITVTPYLESTSQVFANATAADGTYTIGPIPTGLYTVSFSSATNTYSPAAYRIDPSHDADPLIVLAPDTTPGIDAVLSTMPGSISGKVTDRSNGAGIAGITVEAYDSVSVQPVASAITDPSGDYFLGGLGQGTYKLFFYENALQPAYSYTWYNNATIKPRATGISVYPSVAVTGINATLVKVGTLRGTARLNLDGLGLQKISVTVTACDAVSGSTVKSVTVSANEEYELIDLPVGDYKIKFSGNFIKTAWYGGAASLACARTVSITTPSETGGIDADLVAAGSVSGKATDKSTGKGLQGITVSLTNSVTRQTFEAVTGASGTYYIFGVPEGTYSALFDGSRSNPVRLRQWYNNQQTQSGATQVAVTAAQNTSGIDASMESGGSGISGKITDSVTGAALQSVTVMVSEAVSGVTVAYATTDQTGLYSISGLSAGRYTLNISTNTQKSAAEVDTPPPSQTKTLPVNISASSILAGIDSQLAPGGSITGAISFTSCPVPQRVMVTLYDALTNDPVASTSVNTDTYQTYYFTGLPPASYKIEFVPQDSWYQRQWYGEKNSREQAEIIILTDEARIDSANVRLLPGSGIISGTVTGTEGTGVTSVTVEARDPVTGDVAGAGKTTETGSYEITGLPPGKYSVFFRGGDSHLNLWYTTPPSGTAATVQVGAQSIRGSINAQLLPLTAYQPDGDIGGNGRKPNVADALKALRIAIGVDAPTLTNLLHGDIAPLKNGKPSADGLITIDDALLILQKSVGLVSW